MQTRFPGGSAEYRTARDRLLEREIELRRAMEPVAVARRALPPGGAVPEDYIFAAAGPDGKAIQVARSFYAEKLGLEPVEERPAGLRYRCGNGEFALFESAGAAAGDHTQRPWEVDDLEETIAGFRDHGVIFEEYDVPGLETVNGIARVEGNYPSRGGVGEKAAWFKDSEGDVLAIGQAVT
jgi:catechol 2,3-dioxygenase-like lactoylglutathione lyase family enzyme